MREEEWFEKYGSCYVKTGYWEGLEQPDIEGMYQAFKERMLKEIEEDENLTHEIAMAETEEE